MNWQPISTVPKDGTEILLFDPVGNWDDEWNDFEGRYFPRYAVGSWHGKWEGYYDGTPAIREPTHWAALEHPA